MMKKILFTLLFTAAVFIARPGIADNDAVFKQTVDRPMSKVYPAVYKSLEAARFFVIFEPNIGRNLSGFEKKWGEDYNQNKLTSIRSMVFCNPWYANQVSNKDPDMLGFCPLHIGLYEKDGKTTVLFNRPSIITKVSQAYNILMEVEQNVINAIKNGLR